HRLADGGPCPRANGRRAPGPLSANLHETCRGEIPVEGQRLTYPEPAHGGEARGIDEGILSLVVPPQPSPGLGLEWLVDVDNGQAMGPLRTTEEFDGCRVTQPTAQERPSLAEHVIGHEHGPGVGLPHGLRIPVAPVAPKLQRHPERGIDEPQGPYTTVS